WNGFAKRGIGINADAGLNDMNLIVVDNHEVPPQCCTFSKEKGPRCTNGIDDDCDGLHDGNDPDCQ
ncbi:MAG: hypothetical protein V3T72_09380, partial [Thermoanaerobaculia bacterium]